MSRFTDLFQEPEPASEEGFNENASDRDGDGLVQDGTKFERPSSTSKSSKKKTKLG
jgi:hypothetical protein